MDKIQNMLPEAKDFYKQLAENIKFERMKKKIGQQDLADHLGLSRTSIMNIETGRHKPSLYQVLQIAVYLSLDYTTLVPFKFKKANVRTEEINVKDGFTDDGTVEQLGHTAISVIQNFLGDLKAE